MVSGILPVIFVDNLQASKTFYVDLLGLVPVFDADWIIQLVSPVDENLTLTLQPKAHELVPPEFKHSPQGVSIAFVVPDTDLVYAKALSMALRIVQEPRNEIYGQRRFLTVDPDGLLVDVSSECEPSPEFAAKYMSQA